MANIKFELEIPESLIDQYQQLSEFISLGCVRKNEHGIVHLVTNEMMPSDIILMRVVATSVEHSYRDGKYVAIIKGLASSAQKKEDE